MLSFHGRNVCKLYNLLFFHYCLDDTSQSSTAKDLVSKFSVVEKLLDTLQNAKENKVIKLLVCIIQSGNMCGLSLEKVG